MHRMLAILVMLEADSASCEGPEHDLVILSPDNSIDRPTFEQPHQLATRDPDVMANGALKSYNGLSMGAKPGQMARTGR